MFSIGHFGRSLFVLLCFLCAGFVSYSQVGTFSSVNVSGYVQSKTGYLDRNMMDVTSWSTNPGPVNSVSGFSSVGTASQNNIIWDLDPWGRKALIWQGNSIGNSGPSGGLSYSNLPVSSGKAYRLTAWIKKNNTSGSGYIYLGCDAQNTLNLDGTQNTNPYFVYMANSSNLMIAGRWYLFVGYIHANNDNDMTNYGGIYDGMTGQKIISLTDFKLTSNATYQTHRTFDYYEQQAGSITSWYAPRFEEINGTEPTIEQLLGVTGQGATLARNAFFFGNVLIGKTTQTNTNYMLDVGGNIRANKLVVNTTGADFVFAKKYQLISLNELEKYILQYKHLPGIETATDMTKEGVDVGKNETKLLQKIEELTLYLIEQNRKISKMEEDNETTKKIDAEMRKENELLQIRLSKLENKN